MSTDDRDIRTTMDENGNTWLTDSEGHRIRDDRGDYIPGPAKKLISKSGFTTYDISQGHCGLCGSLRCRGECFK